MFWKIYFGEALSYIGISEHACSACQLIGLYISSMVTGVLVNFRLCQSFLCFVLGINSCTLCMMIAGA